MAYNALNNLIDAYIYANGVQAITGQILNGVLKQMVSQLGSGYHLMGVAGPETEPAANDYAMAYFAATAGEYTDFGGITLAAGEVAVLLTSGNGSWTKQTIYTVPTGTADLENTAGFITNAVTDLVNYYTKTEIDGQKAETDAALAARYTKTETDTKLAEYYKKTETYDKDEVDSIVAALSRQEYIVAWDGLAAPDVSAIPAGVTVTYSGTTYTGTLAASASTVNKIYMVWNGTAYDMYGTSQDGGYSWVPMGTTTVDLSQYATKAEVEQLEAKVTELSANGFAWDNMLGEEEGYILYRFGTGVWDRPGSKTAYFSIKKGVAIKVTANTTSDTYYAFLNTIPATIVSGVTPVDYMTGTTTTVITAGTTAIIIPPSDGYFIYFVNTDTGTPDLFIPYSLYKNLSLSEIEKQIQDGTTVDVQFVLASGGINYSTGGLITGTSIQRTNYISLQNVGKLLYSRGVAVSTTTTAGMAFFDEDKTYISGQRFMVRASVSGYETTEIDVPQGAAFARFTFWVANEIPGAFVKILGIPVLKDEISALNDKIKNTRKEIDGSLVFALTEEYAIDYSTGSEFASSSARCTGNIDVSGITKLLYTRSAVPSNSTMAGMAFYDENGQYISGERFILNEETTHYVVTEIAVPGTAEFARFTFIRTAYLADTPFVKDYAAEIPQIDKKIADLEQAIGVSNVLQGKKISVIGDSISCFGTENQTRTQGYNAPYWIVKSVDVGVSIQSWVTWLDVYTSVDGTSPTNKTIGGVTLTASMIGTKQTFTPVLEDVGKAIGVPRWAGSYTSKPWWQVLIDKTGAVLCNNASWSGSRLVPIPEGNTRHDSFVLSEAYSDYTIGRVANRDDNGQQIVPDVILIQRGLNDFSALDPEGGIGSDIAEDITTPNMLTFDTITDAFNFTQAYIYTIKKLRQTYPKAYIVLCTLNMAKQRNVSKFPPDNGTYTLPDYSNKIREIANLMGCGLIEFDKDGITFENCYPTYISDSAVNPTHPNTTGHLVMGEKAVHDLTYILQE